MSSREMFVKNELEKIYQQLNVSYEKCNYLTCQDDRRVLKIFELLFEIMIKQMF